MELRSLKKSMRGAYILAPLVFFSFCKTSNRAALKDRWTDCPPHLTPLACNELKRINATCDDQLQKINTDTLLAWAKFISGDKKEFGITKDDYCNAWNRLKFVRNTGTETEPNYVTDTFSVKFYFERLAKGESSKYSQNFPPAAGDFSKQCPDLDGATGARESMLSFRLLTRHQPDLSRNLLALASLGFWDGKKVANPEKSAFQLFAGYVGSDPFTLSPDLYWQGKKFLLPKEQDAPKVKTLSSGRKIYAEPPKVMYQDPIAAQTKYGSLVALPVKYSANESDLQLFPFKIGFAIYSKAEQERELHNTKAFPLVYGSALEGNSALLEQMNADAQVFSPSGVPDRQWYLRCVSVSPPTSSPWELPGNRCIYKGQPNCI